MGKNIWKSCIKALSFTVIPLGISLVFSIIPDSFINNNGKFLL